MVRLVLSLALAVLASLAFPAGGSSQPAREQPADAPSSPRTEEASPPPGGAAEPVTRGAEPAPDGTVLPTVEVNAPKPQQAAARRAPKQGKPATAQAAPPRARGPVASAQPAAPV